jgi:D-beta-D-heptose 7-phosphate kinase/D-beta-D-heptose 1-phosphate adenosyltransferase
MSLSLPTLLDAFARLRILVLGDAILDCYLEGTSDRICPEAPVPVVTVRSRCEAPGGAANTAANARALGAQVTLLSVIGDDAEGALLRQALQRAGLGQDSVLAHARRRTLAKQRVVASGQILLRVDQGSTEPLDAVAEQALLGRLRRLFPHHDAVIVSDYAYGVLTPRVIAALQACAPRLLVVDSKNLGAFRALGPTAVKPNYSQAAGLLGLAKTEQPRAGQIAEHAQRLLDLTGAQIAAVTLDADGVLVLERGRPAYRAYARAVPNARVNGAGDTFVAAFTLALAAGAHTPAAAELASAAAGVVVAKEGTAVCSAAELRESLAAEAKVVADAERLATRLALHRAQGRRIVFTNGCFDLLHRGHITYLNQAKTLGEVLVVGVNSDASVRRLKGPRRPILPLEDRMQVLSALSCVDYIVPFEEDTPERLIRLLRPDVFVKGGDYRRETLPEAPLVEAQGGVVKILPYLLDRSTSGIIERIRQADDRALCEREQEDDRRESLERRAESALR